MRRRYTGPGVSGALWGVVTFIPEWVHWRLVGRRQDIRRSIEKWEVVSREVADQPCQVCGWKVRPGEPHAITGRNAEGRWEVYYWVHQTVAGERSYLHPSWRSGPEREKPLMEDDYEALKEVVRKALREHTVANEGEIEMPELCLGMAETPTCY